MSRQKQIKRVGEDELRPIVLYGAGSQVHVLRDTLARGRFEPDVILNDMAVSDSFVSPCPVVVGQEDIDRWLDRHARGQYYAVTIGNHHGEARFRRHLRLGSAGLVPATLVHETAFVTGGAVMGAACQILAFAFVGVDTILGEAVILNSRASVDHECIIGNGVHVGPGAVLAGRVKVGDFTFIGSGAVVCPDVTIASNCRIGAGSVVTRDVLDAGVYAGAPARLLKYGAPEIQTDDR